MAESAEELRALVLEPWYEERRAPTRSNVGLVERPPLWTRWPELRPEGLEWLDGAWYQDRVPGGPSSHPVHAGHARALIRDPIAVALAKAIRDISDIVRRGEWRWDFCELALASDSVAELVRLCHRLLDSREDGDQPPKAKRSRKRGGIRFDRQRRYRDA